MGGWIRGGRAYKGTHFSLLFPPKMTKSSSSSAKKSGFRAPEPFPILDGLDVPVDGAQPASDGEQDVPVNLVTARATLNYSDLRIIPPFEMVEPIAWYVGTKYYCITRGYSVGIFDNW